MDRLAQLESHCGQLSAAAKKLIEYRHSIDAASDQALTSPEAAHEVQKAKATILASVASVKKLVAGPADFLQELAFQVRNQPLLLAVSPFPPGHTMRL